MQQNIRLGLAIFGPPVFFGVFVEASYYYALQKDRLPYQVMPEWLWYFILILCLVIGDIAVYRHPFRRKLTRNLVTIIYLGIMACVLLAVHLYVACSNGDCL